MAVQLLLLASIGCKHGDDAEIPTIGGGGDGSVTTPNGGCGTPCDAVPHTVRFARLTHLQWENTVQDLLHLPAPTGLSETFLGDTLSEGFENHADNLQVSPELWQDYQRAAETLAAQVVVDPALYTEVVPEDPRVSDTGPSFDEQIEAEDPAASATTGQVETDGYNLWSRGELTAQFDLPSPGRYTLRARVYADQAGPDLAEATLGIDGVDALTTDVTAVSFGAAETLEVEVDVADGGVHTVHVGFTNDFYEAPLDRNLHVDWLGVEGGSGGLVPSTAGDAERDAWIASFGKRAHRRPLTADEVTAYTDLFDQGPELLASGDDFLDGVQVVIMAMLQSPLFLYRVEESDVVDAEGKIPLSSHELASRLSYALWNTMPDPALFDVADAGTLTDLTVLQAQGERLLADPRAHATVADLHRQLLFLDNYGNIYKDPTRYPEFGASTAESMKAEAQAFVEDVVFNDGSIHELFTAPRTFVNADLAAIYGVAGSYGDELVPIDLDPSQRGGLLTLSGFLALEADAYISSPIRRGVFVNLNVWCVDLPSPPDNVPPLPPPDGIVTTRDLVDAHTGEGTCGEGCHSTMINPPGFALENYDALGRWRTDENGQPIDAADNYFLSAGEAAWTDGIGFLAVVGDAVETHKCYTQHLVEYLHGRSVEPEDDGLLGAFGTRSREEDRPIDDLILDVVLTKSFRTRVPEVP